MIMNITKILLALLLGVSLSAKALIKESDESVIAPEILANKKSEEAIAYSPDEVRRIVREKRQERNNKIKEIMKYAKDSDAPAKLFFLSVRDGVVDPNLLEDSNQKAEAWRKTHTEPSELNIPWGKLFALGFLSIIGLLAVIVRNNRIKEAQRAEHTNI